MPRSDGFRIASREYIERLRIAGRADKTLRGYEYALDRAWKELSLQGRPKHPKRLSQADLFFLSNRLARDPWLLRTLDVCLRGMGCAGRIPFSVPEPTRMRWLSKEDAARVLRASIDLGPPYSTVVHLALKMGFRRISVIRARVADFENGSAILVRGKGRAYSIAANPHTERIVAEARAWRDDAGFNGTDILVPACSRRLRNAIKPYSERGLDGILRKVSVLSGVRFASHDLRRTFGRLMWKAGVAIETISDLLGHRDIRMTLRYLGIDKDDQAEAMRKLEASFHAAIE